MSVKLDWANIEKTIYRQTLRDVRKFARLHQRERFYGFVLTTRYDGQVELSANTPQSFRELVAECCSSDPKKYGPAAGTRRAAALDRLKWDTGQWLYRAFNSAPGPLPRHSYPGSRPGSFRSVETPWTELHLSFLEACQPLDDEQVVETAERFISLCFKVLIRTAREGLYDCLTRTRDFKLLGEDYNDPHELRGSRRRIRLALRENHARDLASQFALNVGD